MPQIHFGIDTLLHVHLSELRGLRVGLVTNNAATTAAAHDLPATSIHPVAPTRLALQKAGLTLAVLFSPEHGLGASATDGAHVGDSTDTLTGLPIQSLYGATVRPSPAALQGLDLLLFDIPDIGTRFYTYIWTLSHVMEACAETGLPLWVLDRPNPLGGNLSHAEGPMLDETNISTFVGRWAIPVRHCLTAGELARLWNMERNLGLDLRVIPVEGGQRGDHWPATGQPFIPPSPNMPSYEAALIYPGTCFCEGTNVSEGRGTTTPFRHIGAPWMVGLDVAAAFNELGLAGVVARDVQFTPDASKYAGEACGGIMLHVTDAATFRPVAAGLHLLATIMRLYPDRFAWLPYPTAANAPGHGHFDRLVGRLEIRQQLVDNAADPAALITEWTDAAKWIGRTKAYLLYATG